MLRTMGPSVPKPLGPYWLGDGRDGALAVFVNTGVVHGSATSSTSPPTIVPDDDAFLLLAAIEHAWMILFVSCISWITSGPRQKMRHVVWIVYFGI